MIGREIECPKCKKKSVVIEHPDEYEIWLKCTECNYFQGMSADDWHRIHNSPNLDAKIRKMYDKEHGVAGEPGGSCRACGSSSEGGFFGICNKCCYKILILVLVIMVIGSYMVWMALL